ncbi:DUF2586 domain-containing protein [[Scytonema hofmanni] UTEX B 1581]|nr:DUF2586 domain-containing protein [[Scytonema hofmanni] UTEX B 1581]
MFSRSQVLPNYEGLGWSDSRLLEEVGNLAEHQN